MSRAAVRKAEAKAKAESESPNANESAEAAYSLQLEPHRRRMVMSEQVISRKLTSTIPVQFIRPCTVDYGVEGNLLSTLSSGILAGLQPGFPAAFLVLLLLLPPILL